MSEYTLQLIVFLRIIYVAIYSYLYGLGGISGKWKRRIIGSLFLTIGYIGFSLWLKSFSFWYMLCFFLLLGATSLGYGGNELKTKIFKRTYCGLAYACASLPLVIVNQSWVLFALHTLICLAVSITLGVVNPTHARSEEGIIGFTIGFLPMFMIGG